MPKWLQYYIGGGGLSGPPKVITSIKFFLNWGSKKVVNNEQWTFNEETVNKFNFHNLLHDLLIFIENLPSLTGPVLAYGIVGRGNIFGKNISIS